MKKSKGEVTVLRNLEVKEEWKPSNAHRNCGSNQDK